MELHSDGSRPPKVLRVRSYLCLSVGALVAVFVPKCFPAVLQPLEGETDGKEWETTNTSGKEETYKRPFPPLCMYVSIFVSVCLYIM